ncbi:MAG: glycosyltransferase [Lachnospiraceae bacterium]|nr:glycosyltransferase [Lachnospiraceae bacterium]
MKKVLHISKYYFPFRGGTEQIAQECVSALKGRYEQKVICFNHGQKDKIDVVDGIEIVRAGCFAKVSSQSLSSSYGKLLKEMIATFAPDIIIFHYPNPFVAHWLLKYCRTDSRLVIYWHLDIVRQKILGRLFGDQNRKLIKRADKIFATSPNYIEGSKWLRQVREKCVVVPNCINAARFKQSAEVEAKAVEVREKNKGKIICLAVGRHTEYKGFIYLIRASKYLDERFRIFIIGKGGSTEQLKKEAKGDDKIQFLGLIPDMDLKAYMTAMDIFCFPSITKNEAFGLALAEAMYYEKPSVTFTIDGSGVNYVNLDGITGIEVPNRDVKAYADAMTRLADDPSLREQYGKASRKRVVENFLDRDFAEKIRREIVGL